MSFYYGNKDTPEAPPISPPSPSSPPSIYPEEPLMQASPLPHFAASEGNTYEPIGDIRYHQDLFTQNHDDDMMHPRVKFPDYDRPYWNIRNDYSNVRNDGQGYREREEGEIDEFGGDSGNDMADIELDDLLDLEHDGIEDDLEDLDDNEDAAYNVLRSLLPNSFVENSTTSQQSLTTTNQSATSISGGTAGSSRSFIYSPRSSSGPKLPSLPPIPGVFAPARPTSPLFSTYLDRVETWITPAEYSLAQDRRYSPYRVKKSSGLRVCWKPKSGGSMDMEETSYSDIISAHKIIALRSHKDC